MAENLILFGSSGFTSTKVQNLTEWASKLPDTAVVLMEDGILGAVKPHADAVNPRTPYAGLLAAHVAVHAVSEDLTARGYNPSSLHGGIHPLSYSNLIDLIANSARVISWL